MDIQILQLIEGAKQAKGLTVVIDVFRAFSVACYVMSKGAKTIIPIGDIKLAYSLKEKYPDYILVGERNEQMPEGFQFGNSPSQVMSGDLQGKTIVQTTSAGTQGIANAKSADEIITGSFVNAGAIVKYIQHQKPKHVSLVCMGYAATKPIEEDTYCAQYIKQSLLGETPDFASMVKDIKATSAQRFYLPEKQSFAPSIDVDLCLDLNCFDFVLKVEQNKGLNYLQKIML